MKGIVWGMRWETDSMTESEADAAAQEHDRENHGGERVAVRVFDDGQVMALKSLDRLQPQ